MRTPTSESEVPGAASSALLRVAMWSGPRNISTAMMRAWGSRRDTAVTDEPLYAAYLERTGYAHPGREEILAAHEGDWRAVVAWLGGEAPGCGALRRDRALPVPGLTPRPSVWYQKQMAHHLLPEMERGWIDRLVNCFLIRDPAEMIASYIKIIEQPTPEKLGLPQQLELFERERARTGRIPPVLDAHDVLADPQGMLAGLCRALGIAFDATMLRWEPGPRESDGVWGPHWYERLYGTTAFAAQPRPYAPLTPALARVRDACQPYYLAMHRHRLRA